MPKVTYIRSGGRSEVLDVPLGTSIMQAATSNDIDGIVAECGGSCMCATCHVYVDNSWLSKTPPMNPAENEMLDSTASPRRPNSRLSCQLKMTPEMDGIVVYIPEAQY
jgi:ferredoxin, 2Fe-2S